MKGIVSNALSVETMSYTFPNVLPPAGGRGCDLHEWNNQACETLPHL